MGLKYLGLGACLVLGACAVGDYSDAVGSFSKAVTAQNSAEASLIQAADTVRTNEWFDQLAKHPETRISVDGVKCVAASGYTPGDCRVETDKFGPAPRTSTASTVALSSYASTLTTIANDTDCTTLTSDATALSASITALAKPISAGAAAQISPIASLATTAACRAAEAYRLHVLKTATQAADPFIQQLVAPMQDKDRQLARIVVRDAAQRATDAAVAAGPTPSHAQVQNLIELTNAVDTAQQVSMDKSIAAIAKVHHQLTQDLQQNRIDLTHVIAEAQAITDDANSVKAAMMTLSSAGK